MTLRKLQRLTLATLLVAALCQISIEQSAGADHKPPVPTTTPITITLPDLDPLAAAMRMAKWQKVAICETGGNWQMRGSRYSGGIGIRNDVWLEYGGADFAPDAGLATPEQQIIVGSRIWARNGTLNYIPDQRSCAAW